MHLLPSRPQNHRRTPRPHRHTLPRGRRPHRRELTRIEQTLHRVSTPTRHPRPPTRAHLHHHALPLARPAPHGGWVPLRPVRGQRCRPAASHGHAPWPSVTYGYVISRSARSWHSQRPGRGARTDLTYLPGRDGHPVFINPTTITTATLLRDLTSTEGATVTKSALRQQWAQQFPDNNQTPPLPQHTYRTTNIPTTRRINKALTALNKLGAIQNNRHHITITDHTILTNITVL
jgi:hypothetical protein